jgi:ABC-type multidrug transport system fused ATPase/permease subunit
MKLVLQEIFLLWSLLPKPIHRRYFVAIPLQFVAAFFDLITISLIIPLLSSISGINGDLVFPLIGDVGKTNAVIAFAAFVGASVLVRTYAVSYIININFASGEWLSNQIYQNILNFDLLTHKSTNSSTYINTLTTKINEAIYFIITPASLFASGMLTIIGMIVAIAVYSTIYTKVAIVFFGVAIFLVSKLISRHLTAHSAEITQASEAISKRVQESIIGIRDILIDNNQSRFCDEHREQDAKLRNLQRRVQITALSPRYLLEGLSLILISVISLLTIDQGEGFPVLAAMALAVLKTLPAAQQCYSSSSTIRASIHSLRVVNELAQQTPSVSDDTHVRLKFEREIRLENVTFTYLGQKKPTLQLVNLAIKRGEKIGIIGASGSGKSTLIDILMGLCLPTSGKLTIDGIALTSFNSLAWRKNISHVSQTIHLFDTTLAENIIASGWSKEPDDQAMIKSVQLACLSDYVVDLPKGLETCVGERGSLLSGGQRQRVGIARAIYKDTDVLVLDEATSALDADTEQSVLSNIFGLGNKTIICITHRPETLALCDRVLEISDGKIHECQ